MSRLKGFRISVALLAVILSCSDDGGSNQADQNLPNSASTAAFSEFVDTYAQTFVHSSGGLIFSENDICATTAEIRIDQEIFDLESVGCFYPTPFFSNSHSFFIANHVKNWREPEYLMFASVYFDDFTDQRDFSPPASGTYTLTYDCSLGFCYPNFQVMFYIIDRDGRLEGRWTGFAEEVIVVNESNLITVSFDAKFYPGGENEYYDVSAKLVCCR